MITHRPRKTFRIAGKRRHLQTNVPALAVATLATCIAWWVPIPGSSAQAQSAPKQPVLAEAPPNTESDDKSDRVTSVVVPATVQAFFVTDLYAKDAGYVSQVNNDIGENVKKGQVLAVIEDPELRAQLDKAQAAVQQAKAALGVAKRELVGMQTDLVLQQVTLKRQKELFSGKAATAQTLDEARAKEGVSSADVETGKAKITLADADLQVAMAEAKRLQALLQYDRIISPFDGVVTRRQVNPGDLVQAATSTRTEPLFTVQELDRVRVFADAPEASAAGLKPGLAAEIQLYGTAGVTVRGNVTRVAMALDPATRTMRVEIDLPNHDEKLRPGMYAQVTLGGEPHQVGAIGTGMGKKA